MRHTIKYLNFVLLLTLFKAPFGYAENEKFSLGAGVGTAYGSNLGLDVSYRLAHKLDIMGAYNVLNQSTIGLQYHLTENKKFFQPRLTAFYGVNSRLDSYSQPQSYYSLDTEYFSGISLGAGTRLAFGRKRKHGVNIDLTYRVSDGGLRNREEALRKENRLREDSVDNFFPIFGTFFGDYPLGLSVGWNYKF